MSENLPREISWMGSIPEDYTVTRLGRLVEHVKKKNKGHLSRNLLSLSYGEIKQKNIDTADGLLPESFETYNLIEKHDIVLRLTDLQNDKRSLRSAISTQDGIITSAYITIRPTKIYPKFLAYYLRLLDNAKVFYSLGSGLRQSLSWDDAKLIPVVVPPLEKQKRITNQLDRELTEIDSALSDFNFVEKLVADKRKAFIDSFFTKESSQQKIRLRHLVTLNPAVDSNLRDSKDTECTLLPMESIQFFTPPKSGVTKKWSELISSYSYITPKDIAIAKVTPCFENGKGLLGADLSKPVFATTEVTVLRPNIELIHPNYLALFMQSSLFREPAIASMTGAGGLKRISEQEVLNTRIPLPTLKNQEQIVKTNLEEISKLKSLVTDINISKRILQERKVSLIQNLLSMSQ
ncbi:restriction endonuclease subunit S [Rothia amarae]|uniref:restriction endonuclease subunit S n=1 Tax=Rothia amarae TaxID=169480 RepID=UPI0031D70115